MKKVHDALKTVYGSTSSGTTPLLSAHRSSLLTDKDAILIKWAEHFDNVLNRPSTINDNAINRSPQVECNVLLDKFQTVTETTIMCLIVHQLSIVMPSTDRHRRSAMYCLTNFKLSLKQRKQLSFCHRARPLVQSQYQEIYKVGGQPMAEKLTELFHCMWRKEAIP